VAHSGWQAAADKNKNKETEEKEPKLYFWA
jgi:hypothetical protein